MTFTDFATFAVIFGGVPLNIYVVARLWHLARAKPYLGVLRERAVVATAVLFVVVVFGLVFANNDMDMPFLTFESTKFITRPAVVILAFGPASYWLWLYRRTE